MASVNDGAFGCPICANEFKVKEQKHICTIPCGHVYHEQCLKHWFRVQIQESRRSNCPKCRAKTTESQIVRLFFATYSPPRDRFDEITDDANNANNSSDHNTVDVINRPEHQLSNINRRENGQSNTDRSDDDSYFEVNLAMAELFDLMDERANQIIHDHSSSLDNLDENLLQMNTELTSLHETFADLVHSVELYVNSWQR